MDNPYSPRPDGFAPDDESRLYCLREGLVNLCAHSDYFSPAHPTIRVFTDRIMLQNPGRFSFDVSNIENLQIASMPRNPNIIRFFRYAKLSENARYGIDKILKWKEIAGADIKFSSDLMVSTVEYYLPQRIIGKISEPDIDSNEPKETPNMIQVEPNLDSNEPNIGSNGLNIMGIPKGMIREQILDCIIEDNKISIMMIAERLKKI